MNIVQIRERGQVTIPKKIRQQAGISDSATVMIVTEPGRIILEQVGITPYPLREYSNQEIKQFIRDDHLNGKHKEKARAILAG